MVNRTYGATANRDKDEPGYGFSNAREFKDTGKKGGLYCMTVREQVGYFENDYIEDNYIEYGLLEITDSC